MWIRALLSNKLISVLNKGKFFRVRCAFFSPISILSHSFIPLFWVRSCPLVPFAPFKNQSNVLLDQDFSVSGYSYNFSKCFDEVKFWIFKNQQLLSGSIALWWMHDSSGRKGGKKEKVTWIGPFVFFFIPPKSLWI